ncbi:type IV secretory system conjugative DNA transfer family protein [Nocardia takedensis]|uniref:type IV secretory system conjugative DNA transfer family protein n=1 Tax=Nocardia takedensis TaxID=259390 RepID=UPI003F75CFC6
MNSGGGDKPVYPGDSTAALVVGVFALWAWAAPTATAWVSLWLAGADPVNPLILLVALLLGSQGWTGAATVWACVLVGAQAAGMVWAGRAWWRSRRGRARFDFATVNLARGRELAPLTRAVAAQKAVRLGHDPRWPGVPLGVPVTPRGTPGYERVVKAVNPDILYGDWEQLELDVWGPRRGKTTSRVIPAILAAPGAVVVTSNRSDVLFATRGIRERCGRVYVFDPQRIALEPPSWTCNLLLAITMADRDLWDARAEKLADIFLASSIPMGARQDAFFDPEGRNLTATLMLAAAVGEHPITMVLDWINEPRNEPLEILQRSEFTAAASALGKFLGYSDRQRDGLFGTAKKMCNVLGRVAIAEWVTPRPGRPQFDPLEFLAGNGTLYALSKEGVDSAGALATALTWMTLDAAERQGELNGGRLPVPLVAALDELANVVRWPDLPSKYSHYGGRGIKVLAILQNWSQGVNCFGAEGMQQLWDAASIRVYGGGVADPTWLGKLSELIGDHWTQHRSTSTSHPNGLFSNQGGGQSSVNRDARELRILKTSQLHQLPLGRAIVLWGARPVMIRTIPYWDTAYRSEVEASLATYDPKSRPAPAVRQRRRGLSVLGWRSVRGGAGSVAVAPPPESISLTKEAD